jgi:hypothetical protein
LEAGNVIVIIILIASPMIGRPAASDLTLLINADATGNVPVGNVNSLRTIGPTLSIDSAATVSRVEPVKYLYDCRYP